MTRAIYPGSFDPFHNGHRDIALRAAALFEELIVPVFDAPAKRLLFSTDERMQLAREALQNVGKRLNCVIQRTNGKNGRSALAPR